MDEEERTLHIVLGCKACQRSGDGYDKYLRSEEHTFCLACGRSWEVDSYEAKDGICPACDSGKLYSEV